MEPVQTSSNTMKNAGRLFFILMLLTIPISIVYNLLYPSIPEEYQALFSILIMQGYLLISAMIYLAVTNTRMTTDLNLRKYKPSSFFLSIVVLIAASPMSTVLNLLSQLFAPNSVGNTMQDITKYLPVWLGILVIGFLPGFIEELIYRGIMFSAFKKHSLLAGILISCISFGLMHGNFNQIPYAIYLGAIFTLLVEATGSLASSMILHMLFNGMNTLLLYLLPALTRLLERFAEENSIDSSALNYADAAAEVSNADLIRTAVSTLPSAVIGLIIAILLLRHIAKTNGKDLSWGTICAKNVCEQPKTYVSDILSDTEPSEKPVSGWLIAGWIMCIALAALNLLADYTS